MAHALVTLHLLRWGEQDCMLEFSVFVCVCLCVWFPLTFIPSTLSPPFPSLCSFQTIRITDLLDRFVPKAGEKSGDKAEFISAVQVSLCTQPKPCGCCYCVCVCFCVFYSPLS